MGAGVDILPDDVHIAVPGIPFRGLGIPHPYEIMDAVIVGKAGIYQLPQLFVGLCPVCAPPEPAAGCLMQRAEQDGHILILQPFKLFGDAVDILHQKAVILGRGVSHYL